MFTSTKKNEMYWSQRKIDWVHHYQSTWDHPHRRLIAWVLSPIPFVSLWEIGCGAGANLIQITKRLPGKQLGGSDVSADAIEACKKTFNAGLFHVESGEDMLMSDKSVDVVLTDMTLIYVDPFKIDAYLREIKRIGRNYAVFCEFHSESWWKRQLSRFRKYHVYDYKKRLKKLGFYDIMVQKIPQEFWPETDNNSEFRYIITARIP